MSDNFENQEQEQQDDNQKLLNSVCEARKERDEVKKKLKDLESKFADIDLAKYESLIQAEKDREERELEKDKNFKELKNR